MRRPILLALALSLALAPVPLAASSLPGADAPRAERPLDSSAPAPEIVPARRAEIVETVDLQQMPRRGSFWWVVGAVVVAGIILAVVL